MQLRISHGAQIDPSLAAYGSARAFVASKQAGARYHEAHFANIPLLQKKFQSPFRIDGAVPREQIKIYKRCKQIKILQAVLAGCVCAKGCEQQRLFIS